MAHYTIEVSNLLMAHANLVEYNEKVKELTINGIQDIPDFQFDLYHFKWLENGNPNAIIDKYATDFIQKHCGDLPKNYTTDDKLNDAIHNKLCQTFVRHFYGYEIGQENPLYWWVLLKDFFDEFLPIFIKDYQQLFIKDEAFITNLSHTTGNAKSNAKENSKNDSSNIAGSADTPQNELDFKINTGDPAQDYNFNYSSNVTGSKGVGHGETTQDSENNTTGDSTGRNATIMSLINELETFANGAYINLFQRAKSYGLFMMITN